MTREPFLRLFQGGFVPLLFLRNKYLSEGFGDGMGLGLESLGQGIRFFFDTRIEYPLTFHGQSSMVDRQ
jgi:hypothetical protein